MALSKDARRAKSRRDFLARVEPSSSTSDPLPDSSSYDPMQIVSARPRLPSSAVPPKPRKKSGPKSIVRTPWEAPVKWRTYKCPLPHDDGEPRFFKLHASRVQHLRDVHGWV